MGLNRSSTIGRVPLCLYLRRTFTYMTPLIEFVFVGIIAIMLLLLAGLQAIAKYNYRKRITHSVIPNSNIRTGAKIIAFPKNAMKTSKERLIVRESISEEEIV